MPTWSFALIAVIFWIASISLFAFTRGEQVKTLAFTDTARPAKGKFVGFVTWQEKDRGLSSRTRESAMPQLEFETESGQKVRFVAVSSGNKMFTNWTAEPQREYPVLYDPKNPSNAQLDAGIGDVFWIIYAALPVLVIPAIVFTVLWLRRLAAAG
jgi:hypothetical protein